MYNVLMSRLKNFCTIRREDQPLLESGEQFVSIGALMKEVGAMEREQGKKNKELTEAVFHAVCRVMRSNDVK